MNNEIDMKKYITFINNNISVMDEIKAKGFSFDVKYRKERIILLYTEMSELMDAIKKDLGAHEEGLEIADIVFRTFNFIKMFEDEYNECVENVDPSEVISVDGLNNNKELPTIQGKINIIYHICQLISCLDTLTYGYVIKNNTICSNDLDDDDDDDTSMLDYISCIIFLCSFYCECYLDKTLQEFINKKREINSKRPFRFNTSDKMFY